jgi:hypothetical protein
MSKLSLLYEILVNSISNYTPQHFKHYDLCPNKVTMRRTFPSEDITFEILDTGNYVVCSRITWDGNKIEAVTRYLPIFNKIIVPDLVIMINTIENYNGNDSALFFIREGAAKHVASDATVIPPRKASDDTVIAHTSRPSATHLQVSDLRRLSRTVWFKFLKLTFRYDSPFSKS